MLWLSDKCYLSEMNHPNQVFAKCKYYENLIFLALQLLWPLAFILHVHVDRQTQFTIVDLEENIYVQCPHKEKLKVFCYILLCMRNFLFSKYFSDTSSHLLPFKEQIWLNLNLSSAQCYLRFSLWSCVTHKITVAIILFSLTCISICYSVLFCFCQTRLVRELEKKFSGKHVVIVAQVCDFLHSC